MRIGIVNDLAIACEVLKRIVDKAPGYTVAWIAKDGKEAVTMCCNDTPDVVLMDLIMPVMDGVEATRQIMLKCPCAILIVTVSVGKNSSKVFEAMGYGALDAVNTPTMAGGDEGGGSERLLTKLRVIGNLIGGKAGGYPREKGAAKEQEGSPPLLAIGASTGGPAALAFFLEQLPKDFPAAIAIIQHVDAQFADGLALWLSDKALCNVEVAQQGTVMKKGQVVLAGSNDHLALNPHGRLVYVEEPIESSYRPSVDVFFQSLADYWPVKEGEGMAMLLTGMGRDGALGLKALKEKGWHTVAQDEKSSLVYGMPKAAANIGAAEEILALNEMATNVIDYFMKGEKR